MLPTDLAAHSLTVHEVATLLGVTAAHVGWLRRQGKIVGTRLGRAFVYDPDSVAHYEMTEVQRSGVRRTCLHCGTPFTSNQGTHVYCSRRCQHIVAQRRSYRRSRSSVTSHINIDTPAQEA